MRSPHWHSSVHHDGSGKYVSRRYPRLGETVLIRLRTHVEAPVRRLVLRTFPDGEQSLKLMRRATTESPLQWWEAELDITEPVVHYRFILDADDGIWHYAADGVTAHIPLDRSDFRILADYHAPDWLDSAVFYQIFPDRFANGDPSNDPRPEEYEYRGHRPVTLPWESPPPAELLFPLVFYGGDLAGIEQHLDYLVNLGVNALYLNPLFTAHSNHKYDVADYDHVDPHFGGDDALVALRRALDTRAMRYVLDIVPNHCGYWHSWFQTALADSSSPEAEFFTFRRHPDDYATWLGVWTLPKLNYSSSELRHRIFAGTDAVFRRWLRPPYSADGWRVDVANMLGRQGQTQLATEIGQGIRRAVKETRGEAYLMGENFFDAGAQLQGDQWDGVMNYDGFTHPLWYWLAGYRLAAHGFPELISGSPWSTEALVAAWQSRLAAIPWAIALQQYNILDSHDTVRIRALLDENDALHRLAVAVLLTFPGIPGLYYGDEIGMSDLPDLGARGCMIWDESRWNHPLREFHRLLIRLRRTEPALQRGGFQVLAVETDTFAYQRELEDDRFIVVGHRSSQPRPAGPLLVAHGGVPDNTRFTDKVSNVEYVARGGALLLPELPQGVMILRSLGRD